MPSKTGRNHLFANLNFVGERKIAALKRRSVPAAADNPANVRSREEDRNFLIFILDQLDLTGVGSHMNELTGQTGFCDDRHPRPQDRRWIRRQFDSAE